MIPAYLEPILAADAAAYTKRLIGWPYAGSAIEANRWAEQKYHFALEIWPKRHAACPGFKDDHGRPITWETRFQQMWHESLADYRQRIHAAKPQQEAA
jgi:hypothetical protein